MVASPKMVFLKHFILKSDSVDIRHEEYDSIGNLIGLYYEKGGLPHGRQELFYSNGNKKLEGNWYKGKQIGWFKYYFTNGRLQTLRQYITIKDRENWNNDNSYLNQVIHFNENGDTINNGSFYVRIVISGDTISTGKNYSFTVKLAAKLFKNMYVILGDFDSEFKLMPNGIIDTFAVKNYEQTFSPKIYHLGENVIRGKVINFEYIHDSLSTATIYFTDKFYVNQ